MAAPRNLGDVLRLPALADRAAYIELRNAGAPRTLTAAELDQLIVATARGFLRRGIRVGARIGIVAANRLEFIASYCGAMRMGAVAVPVNHKLPGATVAHIFRDSAIELALVDTPRAGLVPGGVPVIEFDAPGANGFQRFLDPGELETFEPD